MNPRSRTIGLWSLVWCVAFMQSARVEEVVLSIRWPDLASAGKLVSGTVIARPEGLAGASLRVARAEATPATIALFTIERPAIRTTRYAIRGRVKYESVAPGSYLEMWNHLPDGAFFSRTLGQGGPMGRLDGSSGWRTFVLPFTNREGGAAPQKLVVNLVLQGAGTVEIGPLELVQFGPGEDPLADFKF
jgi:hypothetical protein